MTTMAPVSRFLRSQEEVQQYFVPRLKQSGTIHRKIQTAYIRRAKNGEEITTEINGAEETTNAVRDDNSWIVCGKNYGEQYILTDDNFKASYIASSAKSIDTRPSGMVGNGDDAYRMLGQLERMGFQEYESKRSVYAIEVSLDDIAWLQDQHTSGGEGAAAAQTRTNHPVAYFMAPWGEAMRVELGDRLVMQYPSGINDEVYRIEKNVFVRAYKHGEQHP